MPPFFLKMTEILTKHIIMLDLLILGALLILTFCLAPFIPFLSLDDMGILERLQGTDHNLMSFIGSGSGSYYRPITIFSFIFDLNLFGRNPVAFHLVNLGIHTSNTFLVYYLTRLILLQLLGVQPLFGALLAAVVFGLHPVNVEAVAWMAARTDLLCCLFFLMVLIVVCDLRISRNRAAIAVAVLTLLSLWSKESSVGLTGILLMYWLLQKKQADDQAGRTLVLTAAACLATLVYLIMRTGFQTKLDSGVAKVIENGSIMPFSRAAYESLAALGFYFGKAIYPFPLNFGIITINQPLSVTIGGIALFVCSIALLRFSSTRLALLIFLILLIPPIIAFHGKLPWTPYAERYLYLSMVGFALIFGISVENIPRKAAFVLLLGMILLGIPSMQRVALWTDSKAFWANMLQNSPEFPRSYSCLAYEYLAEKNYHEAEKYYKKALAMGLDTNFVWQGLASVRLALGDLNGFEQAKLREAELSQNSTNTYIVLIQILLKKSATESTYRRAITYYLMANKKDVSYGDGLYNAAKLYLHLDETQNALKYFRLFLKNPGNSMYQQFAQKMIVKIEQDKL